MTTAFQERLRAELLHLVDERREHPTPGRRKLTGLFAPAGLTAVAAAAVAVAMSAGGPAGRTGPSVPAPTVEQVGYTVTPLPGGVVRVALASPDGAAGLQRALNAVGIPSVVLEKTTDCAEAPPVPVAVDPAFMPSAGQMPAPDVNTPGPAGVYLRPSALPANAYLLVSYTPGRDDLGVHFQLVRTPPTCVAPGDLDDPRYAPTRTS